MAPPSPQWLGRPEHVEYGRAVVLDGECEDAGCCEVVVDIAVGPDTVVWSDLYGHGSPALEPGLRFEFDRAEYEVAIGGVAELDPVEHRIVDDEYG
ncbi:MAG: hypothetical protein H0U26_00890 [Acidimicrobiia bacterium]|nr:hypothetical protein [Acidimicrobiia bacterium]